MRTTTRLMALGLVITGLALTGVATATGNASTSAVSTVDTPPPIIEDFNYPGAEQILHDRGIVLRTGDGHILLADCAGNIDQLMALQSRVNGRICFRMTGGKGSLTMEIPSVYLAKRVLHDIVRLTTTTAAGVRNTVTLDQGNWTPVGEGAGGDPTTVLQLDSLCCN